ncbi:DUF2631 domain-containing protein [Mycobacteroides abscessus]|uniref:DUF2631 domain-containing protein n=1 Tax=Mycobacteroides abscessus TaxID=36809 RepID=A0ABD7HPC0_9MYCO|nr:DUF2631 domain-containing protein [Mycobacteroides abscessus]PVA12624.1 DUF2631 domain-containing protein [Mycobacteroides abscessus]PVA34331.1 DUF2631 domain-containing protein [Mycobacteroides abscessus]PVA60616.1 DUF2631 domain-containing protein [Mycobacteroides abscessus]PVA74720.1 DUF2631 domain-containing protein [Mycobacteroides abscessus]
MPPSPTAERAWHTMACSRRLRFGGLAVATTEVVKYDGVDVEDVPSVAFGRGLSGQNPRVFHVLGVVMAAVLLLMLIGNHVGKVEDIFLVGFAAIVLAFTANDYFGRRSGRIR